MKNYVVVGLCLLVLGLSINAIVSSDRERFATTPSTTPGQNAEDVAPPSVQRFQTALDGTLPMPGWKYLGEGSDWYGSSKRDLAANIILPSTVTYSIKGKTREKVDKALIRFFVTRPEDVTPAREQLEKIATQWFAAITSQPMPVALTKAIRAGRSAEAAVGSVSASYVVERGDGQPIKQMDGRSYRATFMDLTLRPK